MDAQIHAIVEKVRSAGMPPTEADDFVLAEGESIAAQSVIDNPSISLYCLDDVNKQALFVETPDVDITQAVFFYTTQYEHAQRVITMPYETLHRLASDLEPPGNHLILVYNIGRCGSSLISQALWQVENVMSLSEPDVYTQITTMRYLDPNRDDEYVRLLDSCTRVMRKHAPTLAIKFRNSCIHICDLMYRAFPDAKNIFMYRHAETWAQSAVSTISPVVDLTPPSPRMLAWFGSVNPLASWFIERHQRPPTFHEGGSLTWLSGMDSYLKFYNQGIPMLALRFEDIRVHPKEVLAALLDYCELPLTGVDAAFEAFSRDSQEGTALSRISRKQNDVNLISEAQYAEMWAVLREHPIIQSPDFIAPGTWRFGDASS